MGSLSDNSSLYFDGISLHQLYFEIFYLIHEWNVMDKTGDQVIN